MSAAERTLKLHLVSYHIAWLVGFRFNGALLNERRSDLALKRRLVANKHSVES